MTEKEFLQEFDNVKDSTLANSFADEQERMKVFAQIKNMKKPVIIFGVSPRTFAITNWLNECDINADGYAVDADYYKPGKIFLNRPVFNFDELVKEADKYIFVWGAQISRGDDAD